jgi:hypothetical protein
VDYYTKLSVLGAIAQSLFTVCEAENLPNYEEIYKLTLEARAYQKAEFAPDLLKAWDELSQEVLEGEKHA